jgi:hypothetical protein
MDTVQNCDSYNFWVTDYIIVTVTIIIIIIVVISIVLAIGWLFLLLLLTFHLVIIFLCYIFNKNLILTSFCIKKFMNL